MFPSFNPQLKEQEKIAFFCLFFLYFKAFYGKYVIFFNSINPLNLISNMGIFEVYCHCFDSGVGPAWKKKNLFKFMFMVRIRDKQ